MHAIAIFLKGVMHAEELGGVYERVWREGKERRNVVNVKCREYNIKKKQQPTETAQQSFRLDSSRTFCFHSSSSLGRTQCDLG